MRAILLIDIGSTYTKVTAADLQGERIIGTAKSFTTVDSDVNIGLGHAIESLNIITGKLDYEGRYACSSAAGGLKMVAVGLVPDLTAEAAKRAALSAGAKVLKTYSYELSGREAEEINRIKPDIILLSGGTDGGNKTVIQHNAKVLSEIDGDFVVVSAGNKSAEEQVIKILSSSGKQVRSCENVMPEFNKLNIEPAREAIREVFLQRIIYAKGLSRVNGLIDGILMPTPSAVLSAMRLLSVGFDSEAGIGDLMAVDVGGATTDVYSIADGKPLSSNVIEKGLPEPFAKRTVEGDLGVRYSANALIDSAGFNKVVAKSGLSEEAFNRCLEQINREPDTLPLDSEEISALDYSLSATAVNIAAERHVGRIEQEYTPFGVVYAQTGKDLRKIKTVIGTGGPVINSKNPGGLLNEILAEPNNPKVLKPVSPDLLLDSKYILSAMGLFGEYYPEKAIKIMKKELINL